MHSLRLISAQENNTIIELEETVSPTAGINTCVSCRILRTIRIGIVGGIGKLFVKTTRQAQHTKRSTLEARRSDSSIHPKSLSE
jgi:hypothetical protein